MTWSRFDDAAAKSPKAQAAGNDAWALWAAAVMYCNRHLTDGHVKLAALAAECLPNPIAPQRARKLAAQLCEAKAKPEGVGLFEQDGKDAWLVHDFLHWNPSKSDVESKRKKDRDRKKGGPDSGGSPPGIPNGNPRGNPDGIPNGKNSDSEVDSERSRASAQAPAPASRPSPPVPAQPPPETEALVVDFDRETLCPTDLRERAESAGIFPELAKALGVDEEALRAETRKYVGYWTIGEGAGKRRRHWMGRLRQRLVDRAHEGVLPKKTAGGDYGPDEDWDGP